MKIMSASAFILYCEGAIERTRSTEDDSQPFCAPSFGHQEITRGFKEQKQLSDFMGKKLPVLLKHQICLSTPSNKHEDIRNVMRDKTR